MNRKELQALAIIRLAEARSLLQAGLSDGAYYLAGYSVECGLKASIAKRTRQFDFPDKKNVDASHTHDLKALIRIANLEPLRVEQAKADSAFRDYWDLVQQWSEQSRYRRHERTDAKALVEAVGSARHGVLRWIKQHW
ncbi:MAG TPA: HEPN domain-containing protein [Bryobacteraceae bacterium]|nr:HEPN domain-containing protein [Bryobacteraceae bacterium]